MSLRRLCEALELSATAYASGPEFLAALAGGLRPPDCVLLDAQMPGMTGLELQRHLVADRAGIPAIVFPPTTPLTSWRTTPRPGL